MILSPQEYIKSRESASVLNLTLDVYGSVFVHRPCGGDTHRNRRPAVVVGDGGLGVVDDAGHESLQLGHKSLPKTLGGGASHVVVNALPVQQPQSGLPLL